MSSKTIYILRHGETAFNKLKIVQGSGVDSELNEIGKDQAQKFFNKYGDFPFEAVITSTLQRTHQTVAAFIEKGIPWQQYQEIDEISWGVHEGKAPKKWMREAYRNMTMEWAKGNYSARLEEGESGQELIDRLRKFVQILKERPEEKLLVCSHGRAMRCLLCLLQGHDLREMENYTLSNTCLWIFSFDDQEFSTELENDLSHLQ